MFVTGIISEYNPFHNGHKYLIEQRKKHCPDSYFIAIMSGNFTQRGEIAILNKWQRAELAVSNGIDLVLELPFLFAVNSAEYFAKGAIAILQKINCIDTLCFGSEYTDDEKLQEIARHALSDKFSISLKKYIGTGSSYASACAKALSELSSVNEATLKAPNTILGIEYLKACQKFKAPFKFDIIKRLKADHNDKTLNHSENFASGTAIRNLLYTNHSNFSQFKQLNQFVPKETFTILNKILQENALPQEENLFWPLMMKLRLAKLDDLNKIYRIREGLEYKLIKASQQATNRDDFLQKLKSKRYPQTNLQRILLYTLLSITKQRYANITSQNALYARVLAFNDKGTHLLKKMKNFSEIPIIDKTTKFLDSKKRCQANLTALEEMLSIDTNATELYNLCFNPPKYYGSDFTTTPVFVKK